MTDLQNWNFDIRNLPNNCLRNVPIIAMSDIAVFVMKTKLLQLKSAVAKHDVN